MSDGAAPVVIAVDQGTSATKTVVLDAEGAIVARTTIPVGQSHPRPGWVEQDAVELADSVRAGLSWAAQRFPGRVAAVGLSTQRESAVCWHAGSGSPLGPVLGWQDRRTTAEAERLSEYESAVRDVSGLPVDPMFSALKFRWLLDSAGDQSEARVGTVDSWLVASLTGEHRIEVGNASRTALLDLRTGDWSDDLLELFGVPRSVLPSVVGSDSPTQPIIGIPGLEGVPVTAVLGDSHAALFGHGVRTPGTVKVTYGSGSSIMGLCAADSPTHDGLVRTIAWGLVGQSPATAFEGNILATGATLVWLSDLLQVTVADLATLAAKAPEDHGINLVPAFAGLGSPWWDERAQAGLFGLQLGTDRASLARAALESVVLQIEDVLVAADAVSPTRIQSIRADGGPSSNPLLMQWQADLSGRTVLPSPTAELSALGAGLLAFGGAGLAMPTPTAPAQPVEPVRSPESAAARRALWHQALARARMDTTSASATSSAGAPDSPRSSS